MTKLPKQQARPQRASGIPPPGFAKFRSQIPTRTSNLRRIPQGQVQAAIAKENPEIIAKIQALAASKKQQQTSQHGMLRSNSSRLHLSRSTDTSSSGSSSPRSPSPEREYIPIPIIPLPPLRSTTPPMQMIEKDMPSWDGKNFAFKNRLAQPTSRYGAIANEMNKAPSIRTTVFPTPPKTTTHKTPNSSACIGVKSAPMADGKDWARDPPSIPANMTLHEQKTPAFHTTGAEFNKSDKNIDSIGGLPPANWTGSNLRQWCMTLERAWFEMESKLATTQTERQALRDRVAELENDLDRNEREKANEISSLASTIRSMRSELHGMTELGRRQQHKMDALRKELHARETHIKGLEIEKCTAGPGEEDSALGWGQRELEFKQEIERLDRTIAELETLVENKIFREAELEEALEREKEETRRLREEMAVLREKVQDLEG
ncbi:uncharacterized protein VTP21DRAFT_10882 [Calcarisporiella thermophila]|uniref:uncharacterized protein n=1 Tax=Calcarisporiella thermophila TaxID=911321 RepID=UPI0037427691